MTAEVRDWIYANLPDDELAPSERQRALNRLAQAVSARDPQAAKAALLDIPQAAAAAPDALSLAATAIATAAQNDEDPPQRAIDDVNEWLAASSPLTGGPLARERYAREWLVPDWIPAARAGLLTGADGAGKTGLALQLANAVANGEDWLSLKRANQSPAPAVYATYEDELQELGHRLADIDADSAVAPIYAYDLSDAGALWRFAYGSGDGALAPAGDKLRRACERTDAKLLVIDNLASAFGGNENDRTQVRSFMNAWDSWSRKTGCATLMIGHPSKIHGFSKDDSGLANISELYGYATDWLNAARYAMSIDHRNAQDSSTTPCVRLIKVNYAKTLPDPIPIGNRNGAWLSHTEAAPKTQSRRAAPKPRPARTDPVATRATATAATAERRQQPNELPIPSTAL